MPSNSTRFSREAFHFFKSVRDVFRSKGFSRISDGFFLSTRKDVAKSVQDFLGVKCL